MSIDLRTFFVWAPQSRELNIRSDGEAQWKDSTVGGRQDEMFYVLQLWGPRHEANKITLGPTIILNDAQ